jgi:hypothetical protein
MSVAIVVIVESGTDDVSNADLINVSTMSVAIVAIVERGNDDVSNAHCYYGHIILLIPDKFGHDTSYIKNIISLAFYAYVEHIKESQI